MNIKRIVYALCLAGKCLCDPPNSSRAFEKFRSDNKPRRTQL